MHSSWTSKTRAWGYEVIRGIDEDDPLRVIRAFSHPVGLAFVDLNTQVEVDYGGYAWTPWMHGHFGDTALHIALKWKRHRAVKALLSLRPIWTIPNEAGVTAEQIVLRMYGKDIAVLKDEQEREYENEAMRAEDEATRRLMATEKAARDSAREKFLRELHAARTLGIEREADILFEHGRIVLADEAAFPDGRRRNKRCRRRRPSSPVEPDPTWPDSCPHPVTAGPDGAGEWCGDGGGNNGANNEAKNRWVSHICRELRRNRFAAQRGAMRRNVPPARAPSSAGMAGTLSLSPARVKTASVNLSRTGAKSTARAGGSLRTPTREASSRVSGERRKRRTNKLSTAQRHAFIGHQQHEDGKERGGYDNGEEILFDSSSAVGAGRWPSAHKPTTNPGVSHGRGRSTSPLRSISPGAKGFSSKSAGGTGGIKIDSSEASVGGRASIGPGSVWGCGKASTSPTRFDRSSRMSTMRTTRILAAGKSLKRLTPEDRLQRKMAAGSVARTPKTLSPAAAAPAAVTSGLRRTPPSSNASGEIPSPSRELPGPAVAHVQRKDGASDTSGTQADAGICTKGAAGRGTGLTPGRSTDAVQATGGHHAGALVTRDANGGGIRATSCEGKWGAPSEEACINSGSNAAGSARKASHGSSFRNNVRSRDSQQDDNFRPTDLDAASRSEQAIDKLDAGQSGRHHPGEGGSSAGRRLTNLQQPRSPSPTKHSLGEKDDNQSWSLSGPEKSEVEKILSEVCEGPTRDLLVALLTSTAMAEDGGRVLAPSFPSISALHELKYCGPMEMSHASALARAIFARPGVLTRLSLAGKRIGDEGAIALAPALPSIRIVDLRSNNIGDTGTQAIALALCREAAVAEGTATATREKQCDRQGRTGERRRNKRWNGLESLSLAGNRIADVGATALSKILEEEVERRSLLETQRRDGSRAAPPSEMRNRLRWLSVAGNPGVSESARRRLLRAGSNRRVTRIVDDIDQLPMIVVV